MTRMRVAVIVLVVLAVAKVVTQEYLYRSGTREVLVSTYHERAIAACQRDPRNVGLIAAPATWARPTDIRVVIGRNDLDVWIWQIDHDLWSARFRNPYLQLIGPDRQPNVQCDYDIVHGMATVSRS